MELDDIIRDIREKATGVKHFAFVDLTSALRERRISPYDLILRNVIPLFVTHIAVDQPPSLSEKALEALRECLTLLQRTSLVLNVRSRNRVCEKMSADLIRTLVDHLAMSNKLRCVPAVASLLAIAQLSPEMKTHVAEESGMPRVYFSRLTATTSCISVFKKIAALWTFLYDIHHDRPLPIEWREVYENYMFSSLGMFYKLSQLDSMDFRQLNPALLLPLITLALPGFYSHESFIMGVTIFQKCLRECNPADFRYEILLARVLPMLGGVLKLPDSVVVAAALECVRSCGQSHPMLSSAILNTNIPPSLIRLVKQRGPLQDSVCQTVQALIQGGKEAAIKTLVEKGVLEAIFKILNPNISNGAACAVLMSLIEFGDDEQKRLFLTRQALIDDLCGMVERTQHPLHLFEALKHMKIYLSTAQRLGQGLLVHNQIIDRGRIRRRIRDIRKSDDESLSSLAHEINFIMDTWGCW